VKMVTFIQSKKLQIY